MSKPRNILCPCCGFGYSSKAVKLPSVCPACCFDTEVNLDCMNDYRRLWVARGMPWQSFTFPKPRNWDPLQTLARLALSKTLGRQRGRRPRLNP